jgi:hypothetical protein
MAFNTDSALAPAPPATPISRVHGVLSEANVLATAVIKLVDDMLGATPELDQAVKSQNYPGVLGGLENHAVELGANISKASLAISRLRGAF